MEFRYIDDGATNVTENTAFAFVSSNRLVSIGSDGKPMFDSTKLLLHENIMEKSLSKRKGHLNNVMETLIQMNFTLTERKLKGLVNAKSVLMRKSIV